MFEVALPVAIVMVLAVLALIPAWWRAEQRYEYPFPQGMRRGMLGNALAFLALTVAGAAIWAEERGWLPLAVAKSVLVVAGLLFVLFAVLTAMIVLVNRPKILVPPRYRADEGVWHRR